MNVTFWRPGSVAGTTIYPMDLPLNLLQEGETTIVLKELLSALQQRSEYGQNKGWT